MNLSEIWKRIPIRSPYVMSGLVIVAFFVTIALVGMFYLPHNPLYAVGPDYAPPSWAYPFGTTNIGQDIFSQWLFGARSTLLVGFLAGFVTILVGLAVGLVAGFISLADEPLMRTTDVFLALPTLPLLIALAAFVKPSIYTVSILIALLIGWPGTARGDQIGSHFVEDPALRRGGKAKRGPIVQDNVSRYR